MLTNLVNHLWQSTLFAAAIWLVACAVRSNRASVRHALWLTASLKFLVPFGALVALGRLIPLRSAVPGFQEPITVSAVAQRFSTDALEPTVFFLRRAADASPTTVSGTLTTPMAVLLGVWLVGTLVIAARWIMQWRRVSRAVRTATKLVEGREVEALRNVQIVSGATRRFDLMLCDASLEPGVVGMVRPVLLWPRGLSERLSDAQIETILTHELAHVARHDNAKALAHMVVQAVFWFHPLVWWIGARLIDERERACDEQVVRQGRDRELYAQSILVTCTFVIETLVPCVSGVTGADLKRRIETIMRGQPGRSLTWWQRLALACAALAVVTAPVLAGSFSAPRPLLKRITLVKGPAERVGFMPIALAQDSAEKLSFEVASVRENTSGDASSRINMQPGGRLTATNYPLRALIRMAYQLQNDQVVGVPNALGERRFDVVAKMPGDVTPTRPGTVGPVQRMMQSLLEGRFSARVHRETREISVYALVRSRRDGQLGPNLSVSTMDCEAMMQRIRAGGPPPPRQAPTERPICGSRVVPGRMLAGGFSLSELSRVLSDQMQRIVVDQTGLAGAYDLDLSYTPDQMPERAPGSPDLPPIDPDGPALTTALQEQLGLKLESRRAPVDVLVIDHVSLPTPD